MRDGIWMLCICVVECCRSFTWKVSYGHVVILPAESTVRTLMGDVVQNEADGEEVLLGF